MGKNKKKMGRPPRHKRVRIVGTNLIFDTYLEAAKYVGGNRGCVYLCLQGMRRKHMGRQFEYVD